MVLNVYYTGDADGIRSFLDSMTGGEVVDKVRSEEGNLGYEYYLPADGSAGLLLVEHWRDDESLEAHSVSENMRTIVRLKSENGLESRVERFEPLR